MASNPGNDAPPRHDAQRGKFSTDAHSTGSQAPQQSGRGTKCLCLSLGIAGVTWALHNRQRPLADPTGLILGLASVFVCQLVVLSYYLALKAGWLARLGLECSPVQPGAKPRHESASAAVLAHLSQPEGFLLLGG